MITNKERREVAARLRAGKIRRISQGCVLNYCIGENKCSEECEECFIKSLNRLADLIEPEERTCRAEIDYDAMEDGISGYRIWRCSCGEPFLHFRGRVPSYCSECGKKVTE